MGTRGAIGFRHNGRDKIVYNHFDSYPDCLGEEIVTLAKVVATRIPEIAGLVAGWRPIDKDEKPTPEIIAKAKAMDIIDLKVSNRSTDDWYCLTRGAQGDLLKLLELGVFEPSDDFLTDSLFCEYAYIINLDDGTLEFYQGFNKNWKAAGRYASRAPKTYKRPFDGKRERVKYAGVELVGTAPLGAIPADWKERFYQQKQEEEAG